MIGSWKAKTLHGPLKDKHFTILLLLFFGSH